jgi:hypothetical protein
MHQSAMHPSPTQPTSHRRAQRLLWLLLLALSAIPAQARDGHADDWSDQPVCTATTRAMHHACAAEASDDYYVAIARCLNLADRRARQDCRQQANAGLSEARAECGVKHDWRRSFCRLLGEDRYDPPFAAHLFDADFSRLSNPNPYFPLSVGNRWEYRGGSEVNLVEVTNETKLVAGVNCIVLRDLVYDDGRLKEATDDWYAAGRDGSSWYCGEEVKDYASFDGDSPQRPELVSIDGSFKHGRDGAKAGVIMPAMPRAGMVYYEEFALGNAEDVSEIVSTSYGWGADTTLDQLVPAALAQRLCQRDCVVTRNYSLLEPGVYALKYYARGIGFFLETKPQQGERLQLVNCNFDARCVGLPSI